MNKLSLSAWEGALKTSMLEKMFYSVPTNRRDKMSGPLLIFCDPKEFSHFCCLPEFRWSGNGTKPLFLGLWGKPHANLQRVSAVLLRA